MFFTIYKTTNTLDGKIYIGKHQTKDLNDGYMGSGKFLKRAIKKHGKENFTKEILFVFDTEDEMNAKEAELVDESFCLREDTYNLCSGGQGGFGFINSNGLVPHKSEARNRKISATLKSKRLKHNPLQIASFARAHAQGKIPYNNFAGKKHTDATKAKMSSVKKGKFVGTSNSQYGTIWITDGFKNRKIKNEDGVPLGWERGRTKAQ